jgi:hypothetical protein
MPKKLTTRGRHTVLPIVGDTLLELRLGRMTAFIFASDEDGESEVLIEDAITLVRGSQERVLHGSKFGETWNPRELGPLLELIGVEVIDAIAEETGLLRIAFANGLVMEVRPSAGYEAWHFRHPRSGFRHPRSRAGHRADRLRRLVIVTVHGPLLGFLSPVLRWPRLCAGVLIAFTGCFWNTPRVA